HVAMRFGLTGPNLCTVTACASGAHAVGEGFRMIRDGMIELAIVGGSEAATLPLTVSAFAQMQALTKNPDPETASRPFDAERDGFVLSEGSCVLIIEEAERAAARGAHVYAEVAGYGASADAFHITAPDPKGSGAALAVQRNVIPPTIHYRTPDPDCDLDPVPNEPREATVDLAISNSFGFGGQNAVVAVRRAV